MIGRKVFSKANNNSNSAAGALGDAIISSGPTTPPPAPAESSTFPTHTQQPAPAAAPKHTSPILVAFISVLATALVGVGVYFLFLAPKPETGTPTTVYDTVTVNDGSKSVEDTIATYDKEISSAKTKADELDAVLSKVGYMIIMERWDEALAALGSVDASGLSYYDQYRLYNHYATVYRGSGDNANADRYQKLANDAHTRDFNSAESGAAN